MNINMYTAMSQYMQVVTDLLKEPRFSVYNDVNVAEEHETEYYGFGVVCFYEKKGVLYSCYTRLHQNICWLNGHHVTVVEREVGTEDEKVLYSCGVFNVSDLDDLFTFMMCIDNRVNLLMVNEHDDSLSYKYPDIVTFVDEDCVMYDKLLENCNYAIVTE